MRFKYIISISIFIITLSSLNAQQLLFDFNYTPKIEVQTKSPFITFKPIKVISSGFYLLPDSSNFGLGIQYEYFDEEIYDTNSISFIDYTLHYHAIKASVVSQNILLEKIALFLKLGPSFNFPVLINKDLTRLNARRDRTKLYTGIHYSISFLLNRKGVNNYGFSIYGNSIINQSSLFSTATNQDAYSNFGVSFTLQIKVKK